ncbi:MAG: hypothetical protein IJO40_11050 [Thermoguttaceae bacterium]|nr:hypothetical protein [Thermoguttaceae bacterium]
MRKFYYICPRCGRCYKRYIPKRKMKCGFCSTVWKTRKAKGTRSAFSWTATLATIIALVAIAFFVGRELGVWRNPVDFKGEDSWGTELAPSTESVETDETTGDAESVEASENVENLESTTDVESEESDETALEDADAATE